MSKGKIIDEKEVLEIVKPELMKIAMDVCRDMKKYSFSVIVDFYGDYSPTKYNRLFQLPKIWNKPELKETDDGYCIKFIYSFDGLSAKHPDPHDFWVFNGPFVQGYHGGPIKKKDENGIVRMMPAPQMYPSPWDRILTFAKYMYNAEEIEV